jgi:hypothetical protein
MTKVGRRNALVGSNWMSIGGMILQFVSEIDPYRHENGRVYHVN